MAAKFLVLLACLALSHAALVKREATGGGLDDLQKNAAELFKTIGEQFSALTNSKESQSFNKALKDGTDSVVAQLSAYSSTLQGAVQDATGKAKEALEQSKANIDRTTEELRKAHPEVEQQATALKDKLQAALQSAVQESQNLAKAVAANVEESNKKLAPQIQEGYNTFVKQLQEVQKNLHEASKQ